MRKGIRIPPSNSLLKAIPLCAKNDRFIGTKLKKHQTMKIISIESNLPNPRLPRIDMFAHRGKK
jgi:hypothetical protein